MTSPGDRWSCVVICSCDQPPRRIAGPLSLDPETGGLHWPSSPPIPFKPGRSIQGALDTAGQHSHPEPTPGGGWKIRWRCPRCRLDLALSLEHLNELAGKLEAGGVSVVELSTLIAIVS